MGIFEIIMGAILVVVSVGIIYLVVIQEPAQQSGASGAVMGTQGSYLNQGNGRNASSMLATVTKIAAVVFFVATIGVHLVKIFVK